MSLPPSAPTPTALPDGDAPELPPPAPALGIRAVDGNRAALSLLVVQNLVSLICIGIPLERGGETVRLGFGLPLGTSLLISFLVTVALALTAFRPVIAALRADTRWRTPPSWGLSIAVFVLAFLSSRALLLAFVMAFPETADSVPQFLSRGADLVPLVLAAGFLIPFAEEVAFRGLMMRGHERAAGFGVAALATTAAFLLAHGAPASVVGLLPLAYALARVTQHSGSLWNAVIVHALNNALAVGVGIFAQDRLSAAGPEATDLLRDGALRLPLGLGALLFGLTVLVVLHLWLTPRPDPAERSAPGPWLSLAYVVVLGFGLSAALLSLDPVQDALTQLQGALR